MGRRKTTQFDESAIFNDSAYMMYYDRLKELAIARFEYENLPDSVDARFLELKLYERGHVVWFEDEVMGMLSLPCTLSGSFDVYHIPINRRAFASNGYNKELTNKNSVIMYNNLLHNNTFPMIQYYARRLWNIDRMIDVNINAQKTPILIKCPPEQQMTLKNAYMCYDGNVPVIFANKDFKEDALTVFQTGAPYVADKAYTLKCNIWDEALTFLGITNTNSNTHRERITAFEINTTLGSAIASRYSGLQARQMAVDEINKMFGTDIVVKYREQTPQLLGHEMMNNFTQVGIGSDGEGGDPTI